MIFFCNGKINCMEITEAANFKNDMMIGLFV